MVGIPRVAAQVSLLRPGWRDLDLDRVQDDRWAPVAHLGLAPSPADPLILVGFERRPSHRRDAGRACRALGRVLVDGRLGVAPHDLPMHEPRAARDAATLSVMAFASAACRAYRGL